MSTQGTQQTAVTKYLEANGNTLAYRVLGPSLSSHVPLLLLMHCRKVSCCQRGGRQGPCGVGLTEALGL
jgi:hypothetical protein